MALIQPVDSTNAPEASRPLLDAVAKKMGMVPNLLGTLANGPAALQSYLSLSDALGGGLFSAKERELVALAIGESNTCDYCLAAHTMIGGSVGLSADEIEGARRASSSDPKVESLVALAQSIVVTRGRPDGADVQRFVDAGWTHGHLVELIALVALNTLTNYTNHIAETEVDFPAAPALQTA
ncbi:MAG: carboxymuconolactone decarboxylase family protein [Planctomycetota bacterium]